VNGNLFTGKKPIDDISAAGWTLKNWISNSMPI